MHTIITVLNINKRFLLRIVIIIVQMLKINNMVTVLDIIDFNHLVSLVVIKRSLYRPIVKKDTVISYIYRYLYNIHTLISDPV